MMPLATQAYNCCLRPQDTANADEYQIGIAQPALSQQIRALEHELGVTLLDRTSRRVSLTDAGVAFSSRAEKLLADAGEAKPEMQEFAGLAGEKIVVAVVPNLGEIWLAQQRMRDILLHFHIESRMMAVERRAKQALLSSRRALRSCHLTLSQI